MALTDAPPIPCPHMDLLIELLAGFPPGQGRPVIDDMIERLDRLAYEARWQGADDGTLAAIQGAKVLLDVAVLPPLRMPSSPPSNERRRAVGTRR